MALPQRYIEKDRYTEEEYLRWEEDAPYKSEYVRGDIRAMSGGSVPHGALSVSMGARLLAALEGRDCLVLSSDVKVRTPRGTFRYPDASVVCGAVQYHGRSQTIITNPLVLVEVQSDSTENTDHGEKLREYQMVESLQSYLLVAQDAPRVEQYARLDNGHWDYHVVEGLDKMLSIPALGITLALADIYRQIKFAPEEPS